MPESPERPESLPLPRLSRTSVFMPTIVSASENPGARKNSDGLDVSPLTSRDRLSNHRDDAIGGEEGDGDITPMRLDADGADGRPTLEQLVQSKRDSRNDSTSTSATGPAGSGMPPAEAAFTCEKEVVEDEGEEGDSPLEMSPPKARIRSTFLSVPAAEMPRLVQSPRTVGGATSRIDSLDAKNMAINDVGSTASRLARLDSEYNSHSSLSTRGSRRSLTEDAAGIMYHTAQTARLKRPSIVNYLGATDPAHRLSSGKDSMFDHDDSVLTNSFVSRSRSVAVPSARERERWSQGFGVLSRSSEYDASVVSPRLSVDRLGNALNPPNTAANVSEEDLQRQPDSLTLRDALSINPAKTDGTPKRSATVPSSIGMKRKARFSPLPLGSNPPNAFHRERIVTTPYPASREDEDRKRSSKEGKAEMDAEQDGGYDSEVGPRSFDLIISARNRTRVVSIPNFEEHQPSARFWWKSKRSDDERMVRLVQQEYVRLIGKTRSILGAKTAKAAYLRFVRSNKGDHSHEPDTPLFDSQLGSLAENDFWRLWNNPTIGRQSRDWLDVLIHRLKIYGTSRAFVLEITEGYDATRIIIATSVVTAVSLVAMFLWLFLGVGGRGDTVTVMDATVTQPSINLVDSSGRAGDAFMFGIWILFVGWTSVVGWLFVS